MLERLLFSLLIGGIFLFILWGFGHRQQRRTNEAVENDGTSGKARLLYFYNPSCATCATQVRIFEQLDGSWQSLIESIDAGQEEAMTKQFNILTLPTTILIDRHGLVQHINCGLANPGKLSQQLQALS
jgi:peroxiredoxin